LANSDGGAPRVVRGCEGQRSRYRSMRCGTPYYNHYSSTCPGDGGVAGHGDENLRGTGR
jgi:hypothetical protein